MLEISEESRHFGTLKLCSLFFFSEQEEIVEKVQRLEPVMMQALPWDLSSMRFCFGMLKLYWISRGEHLTQMNVVYIGLYGSY